ncbi:hypothetical protein C1H46_004954 [Malus baccata]|uniref:Adaptor AP-1 19 kDa protein n=1 Tax=Malus baccata TaxID=106549 RepID=A0A540NEK3_MALBA|nr:hypothetical protein C1H46_004954 [Malus baccata]
MSLSVARFQDLQAHGTKRCAQVLEETCSVCLVDFEEDDLVSQLGKCGHVFHVDCIERWIESSHFSCPICRSLFFNIHFVLLISRQGKVRLTKWYSPYTQKERNKVLRELSGVILARGPKLCNFVDWRGYKVVYKRYASLYFCMCIDQEDNELEVLEMIHHFVEILDRYFGSVCELDLIFNFHKAYYILDEILIAGELQESSKKTVARLIAAQDSLVETAKEQASSISNIIAQATK